MKKIGILGSGAVGKTLASGFIKHGYDVMIGSRELSKHEWKSQNNGKTGSFEEAAAFGDLIVLAVKGDAAVDVISLAGAANFANKTVIDTTNPIDSAPPENGVLKYTTSINQSLMEELQKKFPEANFVKCFNSVGSASMVNPDFAGGKPTMFICGNNDEARKEVTEILDLFGWETDDMGKAEAARAIEPLAILWCIPGFLKNDWVHAFKMLR
ncbi:MAG: NAD(P)-binding domain-containing protein [Chitinophagales bacterium]|nr:NAD(P)-binding domain-containing protein [Chitinophagales bacterium]